MENNRQYNLCSQRSGTFQVPVQIETVENHEFLTNLLKSCEKAENLPDSGESEISDLDCSGLLNVSHGSDVVVNKDLDPEEEQKSCVGKQLAMTSCSASGNAQELINREILQQLQTIDKRLDNLETCKKPLDQNKIKGTNKVQKVASKQNVKTLGQRVLKLLRVKLILKNIVKYCQICLNSGRTLSFRIRYSNAFRNRIN